MPKPNNTVALALVSSTELVAKDDALSRLQAEAIHQFERLRCIRHEETLRGLMLGLMLHRIKASLPYGEFGKWQKANTSTISARWVNYLMRLALVFVEASKLTKPMLLALPGDQTELELDTLQGQQRSFVERAQKFIGALSLSELLDKHGIKETAKLGGARAKTGKGEKPANLDPEQLYHQSRDEIGGALDRLETLLLRENRLQHLLGHDEEIRGVVESLKSLAAKIGKAAKPLLKP